MLEALAFVAPGTPLREGIDRILQANSGGLIVIGGGQRIEQICTGGFVIEAQLTPQRLSELSKMDGAIVLDETAEIIIRANTHLGPDVSVYTSETGTRHRTAERVARQLGVPVVSVSQRLSLISVYRDDEKRILQPVARVLALANQAVTTQERYRARFDAVAASLSALEVEDLVTARDVLLVLQRGEMVRRMYEETEVLLLELGTEGRLLQLQVDELSGGVDEELRLVAQDYVHESSGFGPADVLSTLSRIPTEELSDLYELARLLHITTNSIDVPVSPLGYRFLSRVPRLSGAMIERIVRQFGGLQKVLNTSIAELEEIEGVGEVRALQIKEALARLAESSILDRYS
jgi:diadenylate cyclase